MAVDPTIALQSRAPNLIGALQQGMQAGGMFSALRDQQRLAPEMEAFQRQKRALQLDTLQKQGQAQQLRQAKDAQDFRITQAANAFQKIQKNVDGGDFAKAVNTLRAEKETLLSSGVSETPDIDEAITALESNDATAILGIKQTGKRILEFAQQKGLLGAPGSGGLSAEGRSFERLISGLSPEDREKAIRVKLRLDAPAGTSSQERIAADEELTSLIAKSQAEIEGKKAESKAEGKAVGELKGAPLIAEARSMIKLAESEAKAKGEALTDLRKAEAGLPGIEEVVAKLNGLSSIATHTLGGKAFNLAAKELGFGSTKGGTARASYQATIDNQVLPLLKQTFGAAMTEGEGKRLADTLGDVDAAPEAKQAQLNAFMDSQRRIIENLKRETGQQNSFTSSSGITFTVE